VRKSVGVPPVEGEVEAQASNGQLPSGSNG
jgi:hypothetical protein